MERIVCKKCASIDYETRKEGCHIGLYCKDCGKWIKWQSKTDFYIVKREPETILEDILAELKSIKAILKGE